MGFWVEKVGFEAHPLRHFSIKPGMPFLCGDVAVGPGVCILFGAQPIAESGSISVGRECIVMENAVLRSSAADPLTIDPNCLIGPTRISSVPPSRRRFFSPRAAPFSRIAYREPERRLASMASSI